MIVYLDANVVIYLVEGDPTWGPRALARVTALQSAGEHMAIRDIHRLECLVGPFILNDAGTLASFAAFFADPALRVLPISGSTFERAARAHSGLP